MPNLDRKIPPARMPGVTLPGGSHPREKPPTPRSLPGEGDRERVTPATRARVWKKRFGFRLTGTCVCCQQRTIRRDDFLCGYRHAYASGGSVDANNLEPVCSRCKELMGTHDLESWCKKFREELRTVKPMPKKTVKKAAPKKTTAKKTTKKTVRKTTAKKTTARRAR